MARTKNAVKTPNTRENPPRALRSGTVRGAKMEAMRPNPAAQPAPVALWLVG